MRYRLASESVIIPGTFQFYQDGPKPHKFTNAPVAKDLAGAVLSFRSANNLARASFNEALADVIDYNAFRLGGDPRFFKKISGSTDNQTFTQPPGEGKGCAGCGVVVN